MVAHSRDHYDDLCQAAVETGFASAVDQVNSDGGLDVSEEGELPVNWLSLEILFSADKPAVEALRGCGHAPVLSH